MADQHDEDRHLWGVVNRLADVVDQMHTAGMFDRVQKTDGLIEWAKEKAGMGKTQYSEELLNKQYNFQGMINILPIAELDKGLITLKQLEEIETKCKHNSSAIATNLTALRATIQTESKSHPP